ncbi:glucosaminidase domain-containing protein [Flavobacterium sp. CBA20B-1]|uniref:glucosaminidase domain-containing protein n=1 Tax=unclassified Flavobacterium TaxID=196869 RepID=UPI0022256F33|nr:MULTISPECIES: glucosaminidase domain-containing protein [unclassified Flavobacterium]WCM41066.1 glucosaminidase domain-containing protein [Flavobacterium sp. CBA20B-1]
MKKVLSVLFTGLILMSCNAAHSTKVREKIAKEYGNGDDKKKKVVVKTRSEVKKEQAPIAETKPAKPAKPLLEKQQNETLVATSKIHVSKNTIEDYINLYADAAMQSMKIYGIPASIKLAQGILESGSGNGTLCRTANNHFGIKCKEEWTGETVSHSDDKANECFRKYASAMDSYNDHSEFLANRVYYKNLFTLDKSDYHAWANGLKKAGYATDPRYPQKLIDIIERYKLYEFDQKVLGVNHAFAVKKAEEIVATKFIGQAQTYTVQAGDTLYGICQKFNSSVDEIKRINNLSSNTISVGQTIRIQ